MSGHGAVSGRRDLLSHFANCCRPASLCDGPPYGVAFLSGKTPLLTSKSHIGVLEELWRESSDEGVWHGVWHGVALDSAEAGLL
jgi:hypothetical protein